MIPTPPKTDDIRLDDFLTFVYQLLSLSPSFRSFQTAASYTALKDDYYIGVTSTAAARTITLPALASVTDNKRYVVKDESGGAVANNITIDGNGAETIDGAATKVISSNYGSVRLVKSGSSWFTE